MPFWLYRVPSAPETLLTAEVIPTTTRGKPQEGKTSPFGVKTSNLDWFTKPDMHTSYYPQDPFLIIIHFIT